MSITRTIWLVVVSVAAAGGYVLYRTTHVHLDIRAEESTEVEQAEVSKPNNHGDVANLPPVTLPDNRKPSQRTEQERR